MDDAHVAPAGEGGRRDWRTIIGQPKVWILAVVALAATGLGIAMWVSGGTSDEAHAALSVSPTPSEPPSATPASSESATPSATPDATPTASAIPDPDEPALPAFDTSGDVYASLTLGRVICADVSSPTEYAGAPWNLREHGDGTTAAASDATHALTAFRGIAATAGIESMVWSPDSTRAAVLTNGRLVNDSTNPGDPAAVWLVDVSGTSTHLSDGLDVDPQLPVRWSPDATFVLFAGTTSQDTRILYRADVASGEVTEVLRAQTLLGYDVSPSSGDIVYSDGEVVIVGTDGGKTRSGVPASWPAYSPEGDRIAAAGSVGTLILDGDTGERLHLADTGGVLSERLRDIDGSTPAWSADGEHVAALTRNTTSGLTARVSVLAASGEVEASADVDARHRPAWTSDGRAVAAGPGRIVSIDAANGEVVQEVLRNGVGPAIASGSRIVTFASMCGEGQYRSLVIDSAVTAGAPAPTAEGWIEAWMPVASPDGRYVLQALAGPGSGRAALYVVSQ